MACPLSYTAQGFELQIGTNHFGHWYLTQLLLTKMKAQTFQSRIVVVSSTAHMMASMNYDDLHYKSGRRYLAWPAYGNSKLANILFTKALADRLVGTSVIAVCLHPGVIATNLQRNMWAISRWVVTTLLPKKTVPQGAATTVFACVAPVLATHSGTYLSDCAISEPSSTARDENKSLREKLWERTSSQIEHALSV
jgi:NAD(P)-dependent dehydrogenase (short-subunit alcohol dehydrogenase family)